MSRPLDPHRDHTCGTFEDSFPFRFLADFVGDFALGLGGLVLRLVGWLGWQVIRLLCTLVSEGLSGWPF